MKNSTELILETIRNNSRLMSAVLFRLRHGDQAEIVDTKRRDIEEKILRDSARDQQAIADYLNPTGSD